MSFAVPVSLHGRHASLVPLDQAHHDALVEAVKDGELWALWYTTIPSPERLHAEIERRLELQRHGSMIPFAVIENGTAQAVGMTTFMNIDAVNRRLEIGSTWYRKRVQRSALNTECKLLLLSHAFEELRCIAVEFRTHFFNQQSRAAIERLGAKLDGILRQHSIAGNGTLRDTCVYSILDREWPAVKAHLTHRLERP
jgi:RimJ/RimL family protein N-acetyltransferase